MEGREDSSSLLSGIVRALREAAGPLTAREIVARLGLEGDRAELRREVSRYLYGPLQAFVTGDGRGRWRLVRTPTVEVIGPRGRRTRNSSQEGSQGSFQPAEIGGPPQPNGLGRRLIDPETRATIQHAISSWKKALIDFGRKNKLLYFNSSRRTKLRLGEPTAETLYEGLVLRDKAFTFSIPLHVNIDLLELQEEASAEPVREKSGDIAIDYEASSARDVRTLQNKLYRLRSDARTIMNEQGINTLHLALGLLTWKEAEQSQIWIDSPILLVPVSLSREKHGPYRLAAFEGDVVVNPALQHRLRHDFEVELPSFEPFDGFGEKADIAGYFTSIERQLSHRGWRVRPDAWLSHFSFDKLVMYEDLSLDGTAEEVAANEVLAAICQVADLDVPEISLEDLDSQFDPPDTYPVVDADGSQLEVLARARASHSLVVQGPPGTGKSQTIVNLIGQAIRDGKTVLFVSEKRAALDVVHRRLRDAGLADLCLELHSHRANKREVVHDLYLAMQRSQDRVDPPSYRDFQVRRQLRQKLDSYVQALHRARGQGQRSAYEVHGRLARLQESPSIQATLPVERAIDVDAGQEEELMSALRSVVLSELWDTALSHPWRGATFDDPPFVIEQTLIPAAQKLDTELRRLETLFERYESVIEARADVRSLADGERFIQHLAVLSQIPDQLRPRWLVVDKERFDEMTVLLRVAVEKMDRADELSSQLAQSGHTALLVYPDEVQQLVSRYEHRYSSRSKRLSGSYRRDRRWLRTITGQRIRYQGALRSLTTAREYQARMSWVEERAEDLSSAIGDGLPATHDDRSQLLYALEWVQRLRGTLVAGRLSKEAAGAVATRSPEVSAEARRLVDEHRSALDQSRSATLMIGKSYRDGIDGEPLDQADFLTLRSRLVEWLPAGPRVAEWAAYDNALRKCRELGLGSLLEEAREHDLPAKGLIPAFQRAFLTAWLVEAYREDPTLGSFDAKSHEATAQQFRELDKALFEEARQAVRHAANDRQEVVRQAAKYQDLSRGRYREVPDRKARDEFRLISREFQKKTRHLPLRRLLPQVPTILKAVKPCLLMSPLSVASYLPRQEFRFDVVVFDEASQVLPADAVGAILRGQQLIVLGDKKQLPPTLFFRRQLDEGDETDEEDISDTIAFESILDISGSVLPQTGLRWHYRSKDERLIAFSNRRFYSERPLITFPSPDPSGDTGVRFEYVPDGLYGRGGSKTNPIEAARVADLVVAHFETYGWTRSLGVVALSLSQRDAIELEVRRKLLDRPDLEPFLSEEGSEPFFIKNLETVQGDERDEIILSIGYGPSEPGGRPALFFGPINAAGGERRLNVAITRAKYALTVVASLRPEHLDRAIGLKSQGPQVLGEYLRYVARGGEFDAEGTYDPARLPQSPFEEAVLEALQVRGYAVDPQVGSSGFRIDLAVRHPDIPTRYVLGIECDGATYHSTPVARDRDRLRQEVLESQGWHVSRVWSTDWILHPAESLDRVVRRIEDLRSQEVGVIARRPLAEAPEVGEAAREEAEAIAAPEAVLPLPFIEEQRAALIYELARLEQHVKTTQEAGVDPIVERESDKGLARELVDSTLRQRLDAVREALLRIEQGSYGICKNCGQRIEPERLEALPSALVCRGCSQ